MAYLGAFLLNTFDAVKSDDHEELIGKLGFDFGRYNLSFSGYTFDQLPQSVQDAVVSAIETCANEEESNMAYLMEYGTPRAVFSKPELTRAIADFNSNLTGIDLAFELTIEDLAWYNSLTNYVDGALAESIKAWSDN